MTNLEIQKYYQDEPRFNSVYSRDNLPKKNIDDYSDIGTHWVALHSNNNNNVTYFDSFGVENIREKIEKFISNKKIKKSTITKNIFRIQAYDLVMCGYFCIGFIDFMLKGDSLTDVTNLFSPNN